MTQTTVRTMRATTAASGMFDAVRQWFGAPTEAESTWGDPAVDAAIERIDQVRAGRRQVAQDMRTMRELYDAANEALVAHMEHPDVVAYALKQYEAPNYGMVPETARRHAATLIRCALATHRDDVEVAGAGLGALGRIGDKSSQQLSPEERTANLRSALETLAAHVGGSTSVRDTGFAALPKLVPSSYDRFAPTSMLTDAVIGTADTSPLIGTDSADARFARMKVLTGCLSSDELGEALTGRGEVAALQRDAEANDDFYQNRLFTELLERAVRSPALQAEWIAHGGYAHAMERRDAGGSGSYHWERLLQGIGVARTDQRTAGEFVVDRAETDPAALVALMAVDPDALLMPAPDDAPSAVAFAVERDRLPALGQLARLGVALDDAQLSRRALPVVKQGRREYVQQRRVVSQELLGDLPIDPDSATVVMDFAGLAERLG